MDLLNLSTDLLKNTESFRNEASDVFFECVIESHWILLRNEFIESLTWFILKYEIIQEQIYWITQQICLNALNQSGMKQVMEWIIN